MKKEDLLNWIKDKKGEIIAVFIAIFYLLFSFLFGKEGDWLRMLLFLILPLFCIFYSEEMGGYTGMSGPISPPITRTTPGCFIALLGWVLLLLPLVIKIFVLIFHRK